MSNNQTQNIADGLGLTAMAETAKAYADRFDRDGGDNLTEFVRQAVYEIYPPICGSKADGSRVEMKRLIRKYIRERK